MSYKTIFKGGIAMPRNMYPSQYEVTYKSRLYKNAGTRTSIIMAMSAQWIRDNWNSPEYKIVKINKLDKPSTRRNFGYGW